MILKTAGASSAPIQPLQLGPFDTLRTGRTNKFLWKAGVGLATFLITIIIGNFMIPKDKAITRESVGHDFLVFYSAGMFVREGRATELYDVETLRNRQVEVANTGGRDMVGKFGPFFNPPFAAWVYVPFTYMDFKTAYTVWQTLSFAALFASIYLLIRMFPDNATWKIWGLVPIFVICSTPFLQAINHGQNTCLSLLLTCIFITLWRGGHALAAGLVCGLMFYKPHLGALVAVVLTCSLGWRAAIGVMITCAFLGFSTLITMPGALEHYHSGLTQALDWLIANGFRWGRHVTLRSFWRELLQGDAPARISPMVTMLYILCAIPFLAGLTWAIKKTWPNRGDSDTRDRWIIATIVTGPLVMPYYLDYDLLLLAIPAVLFAGMQLKHGISDKWVNLGWIGLFASTMFNPAISLATGVNFAVILLSILSVMLIIRARRGRVAVDSVSDTLVKDSTPLALAA